MNLVAKDVNPWTNGWLMACPRSYERGYDAPVDGENCQRAEKSPNRWPEIAAVRLALEGDKKMWKILWVSLARLR